MESVAEKQGVAKPVIAKSELADPSATARAAIVEPVATESVAAESPAADSAGKMATSNGLGVWDEDLGRFVDLHEMMHGMEVYDFTVSPEAYDRIVARCLEPPGPVNKGLLEAAEAARKWGLI